MAKRSRMSRAQSKRDFSRKADRVHPRNAPQDPMRGGIRL